MTITRDDARTARHVADYCYAHLWHIPGDAHVTADSFRALGPRVTGKSAEALETTIRVWEQLDQLTGEREHNIEDIGHYEETP